MSQLTACWSFNTVDNALTLSIQHRLLNAIGINGNDMPKMQKCIFWHNIKSIRF
ncbi:hypothetical protein Mapa_009759 [Marchantia paleacea]|nr:hypothetical protein Mapa_009759 [Marchantia paleacea]